MLVGGLEIPWETIDSDTNVLLPSGELLHSSDLAEPDDDENQRRRRRVWGITQLALSGIPEDVLFRFAGRGASFTLRPTPRSSIPLQWVHIGHGTIPEALADALCSSMGDAELLRHLNTVLDTEYTLNTPSLLNLLQHLRNSSYDFGEAYGKVRTIWRYADPHTMLEHYIAMYEREAALEARRQEVVDISGLRILSHIQPRRIWDLYSNRVLPFAVIPDPSAVYRGQLPPELWTVSHSWVPSADREDVLTPINQRQWPVPLPRATTLEHIRVELLNMGAEYVWLDVLCLRQKGRWQDESQRLKEWEIDVPTIGHVYRGSARDRPCVTYFSGLGRPFDSSPDAMASDTYWFNRVWTLQETLESWVPGGLTGRSSPDAAFLSRLQAVTELAQRGAHSGGELVPELMRRRCTTELDRIAGLAYILDFSSLPLYRGAHTPEEAWTRLLQHAPGLWRLRLLFRYAAGAPFAVLPAWADFTAAPPVLPDDPEHDFPGEAHLQTRPTPSLQYSPQLPGYHQYSVDAFGPCRVLLAAVDSDAAEGTSVPPLELQFDDSDVCVRVHPEGMHGVVLLDEAYTLVRAHDSGNWRRQLLLAKVLAKEDTTNIVLKSAVMQLSLEDITRVEAVVQVQSLLILRYASACKDKWHKEYERRYTRAF